jgi:hypothetical protein
MSLAQFLITGAALDAALFDSFNRCDLEKFGTFLTENVEFYDDRDGLSVGRQRQVEDLKNYICGKVTREIVPGTLQVYRLEGYWRRRFNFVRWGDGYFGPGTSPRPGFSPKLWFLSKSGLFGQAGKFRTCCRGEPWHCVRLRAYMQEVSEFRTCCRL